MLPRPGGLCQSQDMPPAPRPVPVSCTHQQGTTAGAHTALWRPRGAVPGPHARERATEGRAGGAAGWPPLSRVTARRPPPHHQTGQGTPRHATQRGRGRKLRRLVRRISDTAVRDAGAKGHRAERPRRPRVLCGRPDENGGRAAACGRPGTSEKAAAQTAGTPRTKGEPRAPPRPKEGQGLSSPAAVRVANKMPRKRRRRGRHCSVWGLVVSHSTPFD